MNIYKRIINSLQTLENLSDKIDNIYAEIDTMLANDVVAISGGKIDKATAKTMIRTMPDKIKNLCQRIA